MIKNASTFTLRGQKLWLLPQKAIYWPAEKTLLIADLHIGKSGHFRSNGIAVPQAVNGNNFVLLDDLIDQTKAERIIFLGDLFHSSLNEEWQQFKEWRGCHHALDIVLVIGNHDILDDHHYHGSHMALFKQLTVGPFRLVHDIQAFPKDSSTSSEKYLLGGHLHPAVQLTGAGRQRMKVPCFYFGERAGILPAFGAFTGTACINPEPESDIFIVADRHVLPSDTLESEAL